MVIKSSKLILFFVLYRVSAEVLLTQNDFESGSYIINQPGVYKLNENIIFNPNKHLGLDINKPEAFTFPTKEQQIPGEKYAGNEFTLGFFAAIVIASDDVVLDFSGFKLSQGREHSLMQRFFALIELGSAPFPPNEGPAMFAIDGEFRGTRNITIRNGILGLSSHHSIHGNHCEDIVIKDLLMERFEVAAISLNAAKNVKVTNVKITNSREDVPVSGRFSHAIFALRTATVLLDLDTALYSYLELNRAVQNMREKVVEVINDVIDSRPVNHPLFQTLTKGLPDGSLLAGVLFHPKVHVGQFLTDNQHDYGTQDLSLHNVTISNLSASPIEIAAIRIEAKDESLSEGYKAGHIHDNAGAVFDIDCIRDPSDEIYEGNCLSNLQIALAKYGQECFRIAEGSGTTPKCLEKSGTRNLLERNKITETIISWTKREITFSEMMEKPGYELASDHDYMFHFNKGVIGVKMDGVASLSLEQVLIDGLENHATPKERSLFFPSKGGYLGYGVRAVAISSSVKVSGTVEARNTYAKFGSDNIALDLRNNASDVSIDVTHALIPVSEGSITGELPLNDPIFKRSGCPFTTFNEFTSGSQDDTLTYKNVIVALSITQIFTLVVGGALLFYINRRNQEKVGKVEKS